MRLQTDLVRAGRILAGLDPVLPLVGLVSLTVYLLHGFEGALTRDLAVYSYGGQQVAEGVAPYVAIINRAGPLAHLLPGAAAWVSQLVGLDDLLGMRLLFLLLATSAVMACYVLARDVYQSRCAGVVAAGALLSLHGFVIYATYGPREKTPLVLFVALALIASRHRRWATAGVFVSLATLTWQPVFFEIAVGCAVLALLQQERRLRSLAQFAVGGLVPLVLTIGYYSAIGQLRIFVDDFLLINARYTTQASLLTSAGTLGRSMVHIYGWSLFVMATGLVLALVWAWRALARREPRTVLGSYQVAMGAFTLAGVLWSLKAFNGWPDCFFALPVFATACAGLVPWASGRVPRWALLAAVWVWAAVVVAMTADYAVATRDNTLVEQRHDVAAVTRILPPRARIFSVEAPQPLVLAHQRNLTRYQLFGNGLEAYLEATWPGAGSGYARWVVQHGPAMIALGAESKTPPWFRPTISDHYLRVGHTHGWFWYARSDLPSSTRDRLKSVLPQG